MVSLANTHLHGATAFTTGLRLMHAFANATGMPCIHGLRLTASLIPTCE